MDGLFGGHLIGIKGNSWLCFYDWDTGALVRRIEEVPKNVYSSSILCLNQVYWSDSGDLVAIATDVTFYVLRFDRTAYLEAVNAGTTDPNEGIETAFEVVANLSEKYACIQTEANL
jgi:coatomer subunit beta'